MSTNDLTNAGISRYDMNCLSKQIEYEDFNCIEMMNYNQSGKMKNLNLNIDVHHVIDIYDIQSNLKIVDITFVQVVYRKS